MYGVNTTSFAMRASVRGIQNGGRKRALGLAATALAMGLASAATATHAATFVEFTPYQFGLNPGEILVTDFEGPTISVANGFTASGTATTMDGITSMGAAPALSATTHDTSQFLSVGKGETFALSTPALSEISFYIGSLDSYNQITFTGPGGFSESMTGLQLAAATSAADQANGDQTAGSSNGRYTFTFDQGITGVQFASTSPAFEVSNIGAIPEGLAALPEPGPWALMILGFGGLGQMLRTHRRRGLTAV